MISDGNILRLLYFLFLIFSSLSSIPCPSFNHTMANFENKNKWFCWMFSAASQIAEVELFFEALYLYSIYWEWQGYSSPCLYSNFASVMVLCRVSSCIPSFSWGGRGVRGTFYTFSSFFYLQSFLLFSCLSCFKHPSLLSRDFPSTFFCSIYFSSCFLFLVFT